MKKDLKNIDELIKESLSQEEAKFYEQLEEKDLLGKIGDVYKGKMGWLAITMNIMHTLIFVVFVYCVVEFFQAEATKELFIWSSAGFLCMIFMAMMKLYVWMQMDKTDVLRELKRIELQISVLAQHQDKK